MFIFVETNKETKMKIVVIFPTFSEAKYFRREDVIVKFSGIGITSSAYTTTKIIYDERPDIMIMAGIAGVYEGSKFKIGDCVLVSKEHEADLGFFHDEGFRHISDMNLDMDFKVIKSMDCPYVTKDMPLPLAVANTMNCAIAPFVKTEGVDVESMEGAPFFYVCLKEKVKFFEVRSISNVVETSHKDWDYEGSIKAMTEGVNRLIDYLLENEN